MLRIDTHNSSPSPTCQPLQINTQTDFPDCEEHNSPIPGPVWPFSLAVLT